MKTLIILRFNLFFLLILLTLATARASDNTYRIFFKDKGTESFLPGSKIFEETLISLSKRSLERRSKILDKDKLISIEDAPLKAEYLNEIEKLGVKILAKVNWENYCVVVIDDSEKLNKIKSFGFVKSIQPTASEFQILSFKNPIYESKTENNSLINIISIDTLENNSSYYGFSYGFAEMLKIPQVHSLGIGGNGVLVGFVDSGFRYKAISALNNLKVLAEYDFIYRDSVTSNQQFDHHFQDHHGTQVLSIVSSEKPDSYIGVSPKSSVALAKTENLHYERKIEEDWFYEGVEWLEAKGVDIINASLGYKNFDSAQTSYDFSDLTGNKAITSRAVNKAAQRGILFVVAAGNAGPEPETINSPADADSCLAIASVGSDGYISRFSSRGGDALGRVRPHLAAQGGGVFIVNPNNDSLVLGNGTSLSSPIISGAAALILSAFPELKPSEIKTLLFKNSSNYPEQNNEIGYGIPNLYDAVKNYDITISPPFFRNIHHFRRVSTKVSYRYPVSEVKLYVNFDKSSHFTEYPMKYHAGGIYYADIPVRYFKNDTALAYIVAKSENKLRRYPYKNDSTFEIYLNNDIIPFGIKEPNFEPIYVENAGSFIYPSQVQRFTDFVNLVTYSDNNLPIQIIVSDVLGKQIFSQKLENSGIGVIETTIPVSYLNTGVYFVSIISATKKESIKFLIF